jgi:subfamily B ATP-binding cassette protein MsbA
VLKTARAIGFTWPMIVGLLGLHLVGTMFEGIGLTMLLPVFHLLQSGETAAQLAAKSRWWGYLVDFFDFFGVTVTVPALLVTSFLAICARQGLNYLRLIYAAYVKFTIIRGIRDRAFRAFLSAQLGYGEQEGLGRIVNDLTTETPVTAEGAMTALSLVSMSLLALAYLSVLFALSVKMTIAAILVMVIAITPVLYFARRGRTVGRLLVGANSALLNFLTQRLRSARLIRLSGMEEAEHENMRTYTTEQYTRVMEGNILRARVLVMIEPFVAAAAFAILYIGAVELKMSLEQIGLFLVIVIRLVPVAKEMANVRYTVANASGSIQRVLDRLASLERARELDSGSRTDMTLEKGVELRNVSFTYTGSENFALRGIDLTIPAKKVTALVGPSGGGKSTLIDLLPRLRVPTVGQVYFDGVPASNFKLAAIRRAISYAPQHPQIFNVSAREHIHYGQPDADQAAIERAAKLAGAHDFIMSLPEGYDTVLSEGGARLSGGQRQRLDLARALLKPAKILILDEPTSQLDADAEHKFREALLRIKTETDLTIVIVGHRFSTLSIADQIAVLQEGELVDVGTHAELTARGGWYAKAYRQQYGSGRVDAAAG